MRRLRFAALLAVLWLLASSGASAAEAVFLLYDTSGSLSGPDLVRAVAVGRALIDSFGPEAAFGVMRFDDRPELLAALGPGERALQALGALHRSGTRTTLYDALFLAMKELRGTTASRRILVLMSDGRDESGSVIEPADVEERAREAEVAIFALGVGNRVEADLLRRLARATHGAFYESNWLDDPAGLARDVHSAVLPPPVERATPKDVPLPGASPPRVEPAIADAAQAGARQTPSDARVEPVASRPSEPASGRSPFQAALVVGGLALALGGAVLLFLLLRRPRGPRPVPKRRPEPTASEPFPTLGADADDELEPAPLRPAAHRLDAKEDTVDRDAEAWRGQTLMERPAELLEEFDDRRPRAGADSALPTEPLADATEATVMELDDEASALVAGLRSSHGSGSPEAASAGKPQSPAFGSLPTAVGGLSLGYAPTAGVPIYVPGQLDAAPPSDATAVLVEEPVLIVAKGVDMGRSYPLASGRVSVGRGPDNGIRLADDTVSTRHCEVLREGLVITLHDLGSTNGTTVNGVRVTGERYLEMGDIIAAGETELVLRAQRRRA